MLNFAVVGCGYWGPNLIRNLGALKQCGTLFCCDTDPRQLARVKAMHPQVRVTESFDEITSNAEIDAVVIATPVATHHRLAEQCLTAGKHVLVEKPMAASSAECEDLIRHARASDRVLMVGHTFEYSVAVNKIKQIIESGELGEILYLSFLRLNLGPYRPDINVVWDLAPHDISILLYLQDAAPIGVSAHGKAFLKRDIEDIATVTLYFDDGKVAFFNDSWLDPCKVRRTTVVGSKKMLVYDDIDVNEKIKIFDKGIDAPAYYETYADFHFSYRYGDIYSPRIEDKEPLHLECQHFVDSIVNKTPPRSDGASGARVVRILEAITTSMANRGEFVELGDGSAASRPAQETQDWIQPPVAGELPPVAAAHARRESPRRG